MSAIANGTGTIEIKYVVREKDATQYVRIAMIVVTVARAERDELEGPGVARGPSEIGDRYGESLSCMLICQVTIRVMESANIGF